MVDGHQCGAADGIAPLLAFAGIGQRLLVSALAQRHERWLALVAGTLVWVTEEGVSWPVALFVAALVNLLLAGGLGWYIYTHVDELMFEATLRQLRRSKDEVKEAAGATP